MWENVSQGDKPKDANEVVLFRASRLVMAQPVYKSDRWMNKNRSRCHGGLLSLHPEKQLDQMPHTTIVWLSYTTRCQTQSYTTTQMPHSTRCHTHSCRRENLCTPHSRMPANQFLAVILWMQVKVSSPKQLSSSVSHCTTEVCLSCPARS